MSKIPDEGSVVVQFGAKWCSPCKHIRPHVEHLAQDVRAKYVYLDIEEDFTYANKYSVQSMPTIITFKGGQEMGRVAGANKKAIEGIILAL